MESPCSEPEKCMHVVAVARQDRWQIRQRLLDLSILATCTPDGNLHVEVNSGVDVIQVRSVLQQFQSRRAELVDWLEDCWTVPSPNCAS